MPAFDKAFAKAMELHSYLLLSLTILYQEILSIKRMAPFALSGGSWPSSRSATSWYFLSFAGADLSETFQTFIIAEVIVLPNHGFCASYFCHNYIIEDNMCLEDTICYLRRMMLTGKIS